MVISVCLYSKCVRDVETLVGDALRSRHAHRVVTDTKTKLAEELIKDKRRITLKNSQNFGD